MMINFLTILCLSLFSAEIFSSVFNQKKSKTHVRWSFSASKDDLVLEKRGGRVLLKTLNGNFFEEAKKSLAKVSLDPRYIKKINFNNPNSQNNVSTITIELANSDVELFSFYKDRERRHIFDFWSDVDEVSAKKAAVHKKDLEKELIKRPVIKKKVVKKKSLPVVVKEKKKRERQHLKLSNNPLYRDYRYGSPLVWNYEGIGPELKKPLSLVTKTPEFFYPIKNRDFNKSEQEAHLQLAINFYRKKKYGLMYKSIKLFKEKYGESSNVDFLEYLKVNAIIRDHLNGGNREPLKMALNMLESISQTTKDYELSKAAIKYLLSYHIEKNNFIEILKLSKSFYVTSKENFDYEESRFASEAILYSLAGLKQTEKVTELLKEKTIKKILPKQLMVAYRIYVAHSLNDMDEVIDIFEKEKTSLKRPIHSSILFNTAEAYYRKASYEKSTKLFDQFLTNYSYSEKSAHARLRIALNYELAEKDIDKTLALYRNAINRSQSNQDVSLEAKIRYVALRSVRKIRLSDKDKEIRVFLEVDPKRRVTKDLKKLLWMVRLRTFINDKDFLKALSYLNAIPLTSLKPVERRVFESDGAEIVYGLIQKNYTEAKHAQVVKIWNIYKNRYVSKVANDPYLNFIVGQSYLKLGLFDGFDKVYAGFKKLGPTPVRSYPNWFKRPSLVAKGDLTLELAIIKDLKVKNIKAAERNIALLEKKRPELNKANYYKGLIAFERKNYSKTAKMFETFLSEQEEDTFFDPQDLAKMMRFYTDSLYELNLLDKYKRVSKAILSDTIKYAPANPFIRDMRERLEYLNVEILSGRATKAAFLQLEPKIISFLKKYPESTYRGRMNYLLGISFIKNKKDEKGQEIFSALLKDEKVSNYIKELVRTELSLINIRKRTI